MRRVADWIGRSLITLGAITLLFVAYQLWGTNFVQAQEQRGLKSDFRDRLEAQEQERPRAAPATTTTTAAVAATTTTTTMAAPPPGEALGILTIPAIGLDAALVEGTGREELKKGPGHYPHSPLPGHEGNVAIAGHRTTYGAPFMDLDELEPGAEITVATLEGTFRYVVTEQFVTGPKDVSVIDFTDDARLTLTTCHPKYSARERLITVAHLMGEPIVAPEPEEPPKRPGPDELVGEDLPEDLPEERPRAAGVTPQSLDAGEEFGLAAVDRGTVLWTLVLLAVGGVWWLGFRLRRRWYTWAAGVLPFLLVLFFFFGEVESLLPANY